VPGPLMALLFLASAATVVGLGRSRLSGNRVAVALLAGSGLTTTLVSAALVGFSWRYQLTQLALLPTAGALAVHSLVRGAAASSRMRPPPLRPLDRAATWLVRLPVPAAWRPTLRRGLERGWCQSAVAVLTGVLAGGSLCLVAVSTGWFLMRSALLLGAPAGGCVILTLLIARRRAVRPGAAAPNDGQVDGTGSGAGDVALDVVEPGPGVAVRGSTPVPPR
jgi:hypothetical protein